MSRKEELEKAVRGVYEEIGEINKQIARLFRVLGEIEKQIKQIPEEEL